MHLLALFFFFFKQKPGVSFVDNAAQSCGVDPGFFFFFVSSDTRIPEDTRAQHLRGPPSSCFLGATHNLMLQECSVPRKTTESTGVASPAS